MTTETRVQALIDTLTEALTDAKKFDNGNASAGTRIRQAMQNVKSGAQDVRVAVQDTKNARKAA